MAETVALNIKIDAKGSVKSLGDLEKRAGELNEKLRKVPLGSEAFKELKNELVSVNKEIKNTELSMEALDNEQVASEIGSVAGAVGDMTAAFILLGGEGGAIEETAKNIQVALGVSMAFKGAIEGVISFQKLWNNVLKKTAIVQKTINVIQKITLAQWALITAAVGAIIVLYNKFFGEVEKVNTIQKEYNETVQEANKSAAGEIAVMKSLIQTAKDETKSKTARNDAIKKLQDQYPDYLGNLSLEEINTKKVDDAVKDLTKSLRLKARAKAMEAKLSEKAAEQIKIEDAIMDDLGVSREDAIKLLKLEGEEMAAISRLNLNQAGNLKNLEENQKAAQEVLDKYNISLKANSSELQRNQIHLGVWDGTYKEATESIDKYTDGLIESNTAQSDLTKAQEENLGVNKEQTERDALIIKAQELKIENIEKLTNAELKAQIKLAEAKQKKDEADQKKADADAKKRSDARKERVAREKEALFDLEVARKEADANDILDAKEKAEALINIEVFKHKKELENKQLTDGEKELLEFEHQQRIAEISQEFVDAEIEREKAEAERLAEKRQQDLDDWAEFDNLLNEQKEESRKKEIEDEIKVRDAKLELAAGTINALIQLNDAFSGHTEAQQKKAFERNKKLQIAQALIGASQGVVNILANASTIPDPFGTIYKVGQLAILSAVTTAQIAKISQQQFQSGGSAPSPSISRGGAPSLTPVTNTSTLVPQEPQQVFVTETDITQTQNKVSVIESQATIK